MFGVSVCVSFCVWCVLHMSEALVCECFEFVVYFLCVSVVCACEGCVCVCECVCGVRVVCRCGVCVVCLFVCGICVLCLCVCAFARCGCVWCVFV